LKIKAAILVLHMVSYKLYTGIIFMFSENSDIRFWDTIILFDQIGLISNLSQIIYLIFLNSYKYFEKYSSCFQIVAEGLLEKKKKKKKFGDGAESTVSKRA
jgi:hypothetical protein